MPARPPLTGGTALRASRIFAADGRTVVIAVDHTITGIPDIGALADLEAFLATIQDAGADAVLVTPGVARAYAGRFGRLGVIVRLDGGPTSMTGDWDRIRPLLPVEAALRLGADGVAVMGLVGTGGEAESLEGLGRVTAAAARWGVPVLAEMLPGGWDNPEVTVGQIAAAARIGADLGASIVKVPFAGDAETFRQVTGRCYVPVVVLGGGKGADVAGRLAASLLAGAAGVAVGRDVWLAARPGEVASALVRAVHGGG